MIPERVYTPLGIIACPLDHHCTYAMFPRVVYTPLRIIVWPSRLVEDPRDDS